MVQEINLSQESQLFAIVIDDDEEIRELIRDLFPQGRIETCREYASMIDFTNNFLNIYSIDYAIMPFLIFIDIRMQEGYRDGIELLIKIKENELLRGIPTIMISGSDEESDIYDSYHAGANLYIVQSSDPTEFENVIRTTIDAFSVGKVAVDIYPYYESIMEGGSI